MTIRPYKPRDSARSALLTAVHVRTKPTIGRALPCTPEGYYTALRPLTGAAKDALGARVCLSVYLSVHECVSYLLSDLLSYLCNCGGGVVFRGTPRIAKGFYHEEVTVPDADRTLRDV
jgi:hypothetical protein